MKFLCECGHVIRDQTDDLPYKAYSYPDQSMEALYAAIDRLMDDQQAKIDEAAELITAALLNDAVLQVFGTGHARLAVHEMAGRAGGLMPINLVRVQDLVFFGDREPAEIGRASCRERVSCCV